MSIPISCYDNIIGITRTECECYSPPSYQSLSGLYLDEIEPLDQLKSLDICENTDMWLALERARNNAIRYFIQDTNTKLITKHKLSRHQYKGGIGNAAASTNKSLYKNYAGVRIYCADILSGKLQINKIGTLFAHTGTIALYIYNNLNQLIDTLVLNTTANIHTQNEVDITLPLHSDYIDNLEYYFVYSSDYTPRLNEVYDCCDISAPIFNIVSPTFSRPTTKRWLWSYWVMVGAIEVSSLDFINLSTTSDNSMNGLTFNVDLCCDIGDVLCKSALDYQYDPIASSIAHAIMYKSIEIALRNIIASSKIDRETMTNQVLIEKFMMDYKKEYDNLIDSIIDNADLSKTDCLECRNNHRIETKAILS